MNIKLAQKGVLVCIIAILVITVLEFPPPIGFETRPQTNVSIYWLFLFLSILISEIVAMIFIFKRPSLGWKFGTAAAILNILQIIADQMHLMQPEVAPLGYSILEYTVGILSVILIYLSLRVRSQQLR